MITDHVNDEIELGAALRVVFLLVVEYAIGPEPEDQRAVERLARQLLQAISQPIQLNDREIAGSGSIGKLQSFIVVTAVPVSLVLLPSLWDALRITLAKGRN